MEKAMIWIGKNTTTIISEVSEKRKERLASKNRDFESAIDKSDIDIVVRLSKWINYDFKEVQFQRFGVWYTRVTCFFKKTWVLTPKTNKTE
jgi:hypothetical protein